MKPYKRVMSIPLCLVLPLLASCGLPKTATMDAGVASDAVRASDSASEEIDIARSTLILFFEALSYGDYPIAAQVYWRPNPLQLLYRDIDPENSEALLARACESVITDGCSFYCWRIKDVVGQAKLTSRSYVFTVRFEDSEGNLLRGGDNVTPEVCPPPGCMRTEYTYTVIKEGEAYYVEGVPVFIGCWP